jgi:hypothetical protein
MKKIYIVISTILSFACHAQLSLTQPFNEPFVGNVFTKQLLDSVGVVPKNTGTNQLWDYSMFTINSNLETSTYTTVPSVPYGPTYTSATYVESNGQGEYTFFKSSPYKLEVVGIQTPDVRLNLNNNKATAFMYPITMGYSKSDPFSGTAIANGMNGSVNGNVTVLGSGTGTLIVPGGTVYNNVLQVKTTQTAIASFAFGIVTVNFKETNYSYFHASQKFPILVVSYQNATGAATSNSVKIKLNNSAVVGINDLSFDESFSIFPNPAKDYFNVSLYNPTNANCTIEILNTVGQTLQLFNLTNDTNISNDISISNLASGMYLVKTTLGNKVSVKKLIVE